MEADKDHPQRKRPVHRILSRQDHPTIIFVTVCVRERRPVLASHSMHDLLVDVWKNASAWLVGRYVLMPDHVHAFVAPGEPALPLTNWISFWKRAFTKRHGEPIWQDDYWDTTLRSREHAIEKWEYVRENPVRKRLVGSVDAWPWQGELNVLTWR